MQSNPPPPTLVMNTSNGRKEVPLRDYLNARIAPFLKKAMTESIGSEAEYPLQWLGEHLIHQSMLYENNPDSTNIRERFRYKFDAPKSQQHTETTPQVNGEPAVADTSAKDENAAAAATAAASVLVPAPQDATMMNGESSGQAISTEGAQQIDAQQSAIPATTSEDVDMGGAS